jgi:hypothetical protein
MESLLVKAWRGCIGLLVLKYRIMQAMSIRGNKRFKTFILEMHKNDKSVGYIQRVERLEKLTSCVQILGIKSS